MTLSRKNSDNSPDREEPDRLAKAVVALAHLVERLRGPGGCPWDAKQTDSTIRLYLIEEAYEVLDAVERNSPDEVCQELGDLLFQILFLAHLASERGEYTFATVVEKITEKMIHRHPHVFGEASVKNAEDVALRWSKIKKAEKEALGKTPSLLDGVPSNLPPLLLAYRLTERASKAASAWPGGDETWKTLQEKWVQLGAALSQQSEKSVGEHIGEILFLLANLARQWGFNGEDLLRTENREFQKHFESTERRLRDSGIDPEEASYDQMRLAWKTTESEIK